MLLIFLIVICTFVICFAISHIFLSVFVYENKHEIINFKNDIFSYIFGFSNILLIMIICEIADVDDFQIRNITLVLFLWSFIGIMFYIIPYYILNQIFCRDSNHNQGFFKNLRKILVFAIFLFYLFFANKFLFLFKDEGYLKNSAFSFLLFYIQPVYMMEYLSIVGILASAILSGYGSTHCILNYLVYPFFKNYLETQHKLVKDKMHFISEEISLKENEMNFSDSDKEINLERERKSNVGGTFKGFFNYLIGKDNKKDMNKEVDELKILYSEMEMQVKLLKEKTLMFRNNFISSLKYFFNIITGKILAFYCIYRIVMTVKNLLFQNYSDINVMLREEVLNIIDFALNIVFYLLKLDVETIYYTVIEQYFSLIIVGSIIIVNIRSFLNTILFIYTKTLKKYNTKVNKNVQLLFLSYFVGLFYVTSSIFLIFNLPITYRYVVI